MHKCKVKSQYMFLLGCLNQVSPFFKAMWVRSIWNPDFVLMFRAVAVQLGFFFHMQHSMGIVNLMMSKPLILTVCLMLFFAAVIALFKDIPDVKGDEEVKT